MTGRARMAWCSLLSVQCCPINFFCPAARATAQKTFGRRLERLSSAEELSEFLDVSGLIYVVVRTWWQSM